MKKALDSTGAHKSSSSGRPPSRDGLAKPTAEAPEERQRSRRQESGRQPGGQRGRAGAAAPQGAAKDLRELPQRGGRPEPRGAADRARHGPETGPEPAGRPCGPRRKSWPRGSPRGSRPRRAGPPVGRKAAKTEPEQLLWSFSGLKREHGKNMASYVAAFPGHLGHSGPPPQTLGPTGDCPGKLGRNRAGRSSRIMCRPIPRRDRRSGRAVECTGLENRRALKRTVGSNPTSSAKMQA